MFYTYGFCIPTLVNARNTFMVLRHTDYVNKGIYFVYHTLINIILDIKYPSELVYITYDETMQFTR